MNPLIYEDTKLYEKNKMRYTTTYTACVTSKMSQIDSTLGVNSAHGIDTSDGVDTSDSRANESESESGVEEGIESYSDADSGAGIITPLLGREAAHNEFHP